MPTRAIRNVSAGVLGFLLALVTGPLSAQAGTDGEWTMPARDYSSTRFSRLAEITPSNATRLRPVWTFSTGVLAGHQGQPLVVKNTMYVVTPWPNVLYAFDLTQEGYPLKWKYRPDVSPNAIGVSCCDVINRGAFYADGKIIYNLLDGHTVAVDAESGKELWKTTIADVAEGWAPAGRGVFVEHITVSEDSKSFTSKIRYDAFDTAGKPAEGGGEATGRGVKLIFQGGAAE